MTDTPKTTTSLPLGVPLQVAQDIGDRLRATREQLNMGINQLSLRVRIRESYLESMESGRWHELPPGLNGRGLVRVYAKELGVNLPEMIPQEGLRQSHPQYVPSIEVSVVSRKDYEQRMRNSPPEKDQRSRFASAQQPLPPVRPAAPRVFATPRATTLPERRSYSPTASVATQIKNPLARINEREDESLMDVISPDVASILGIQPSDLSSHKKDLNEAEKWESNNRSQVDAETLVANLLGTDFGHSEPPQSQPISKMFGEQIKVRGAEEFVPDVEDEVTVLSPQSAFKTQDHLHPQTVYAQTQYANTEPAQTVNLESKTEHAKEVEAPKSNTPTPAVVVTSDKTQSAPIWKYALGGLVFVTLAFGLVRTINSKNNPDLVVVPEANEASDSSESESTAVENSDEVAGGKMERVVTPETIDPAKSGAQPSVDAPGATDSLAAVAPEPVDADLPQVSATEVPSAAISSSTGLQKASGGVDSTTKGIETSLLGTGSVREATLRFMEPVEVQVTADGKKVLDGIQEKGEFKFSFAKKVEVFVTDGSKVKLKYGGWDHGLLGHPGRKRRLILNAESYGDDPKVPR